MKLIGEKVLVRKITENITKAGIILPADKEPLLHKGEVCFVGGEVDSVSVGDIVFFAHYIKKDCRDRWSRISCNDTGRYSRYYRAVGYMDLSSKITLSKKLSHITLVGSICFKVFNSYY